MSEDRAAPTGKLRSVTLVVVAQLLAMSLWFAAAALVPQLEVEWSLSGNQKAWLSLSQVLGFVAGTLGIALLGLADRVSVVRLIVVSALFGGVFNGGVVLLDSGYAEVLIARFLTGVALAGVYPPSIKLIGSWTQADRGLWIGVLVGALTLGSAMPHLINGLPLFGDGGMPPWRDALLVSSGLALLAALIIGLGVREGPHFARGDGFRWKLAAESLTERAPRLANFGYFGHMWELYAVWTWVPILLIESYGGAGRDVASARIAAFSFVGIGALGCVLAGVLADKLGRTKLTIWSLVVSGACCLVAGGLAERPTLLTVVCLIWGFAVVADSAQFSAAITELSRPEYVGTALTVQMCIGFLLTMATIWLLPLLRAAAGWQVALAVLALGPLFGIVSMWRLRSLPEAERMASGRR